MDFMNDLYELMGEPTLESILEIAQEAEDITGQAQSDAADATGKKQVGTDIDMNTDDILGTKTPDKNDKEDDGGDEDPDNTPGDDNANPTGDEDDGEGGDTSPSDSDDQKMENSMDEMNDPFEKSRKKKLWLQFKALHKSMDDSITLITKYVPNVSDAPTIKALDNIKENLVDAKDYVYRLLTEEYNSMSYPKIQEKYIGVNNIYDLCANELEEYFDRRNKE